MSEWICPVTGKPCAEARVYQITEIRGDTAFSIRCCRRCASVHIDDLNRKAQGQGKEHTPNAMEFLSSLLGDFSMESTQAGLVVPIKTGDKSEDRCPGCGFTIHDILGGGKLGCAKCYEYFRDQMKSIVPEAQYDAKEHLGKAPEQAPKAKPKKKLKADVVDPEAIRAMIQAKMEAAIRAEDYETAGLLREQLRRLDENRDSL